MKVFITGDRSMPLDVAVVHAARAIGMLAAEATLGDDTILFATGENRGFEEGVRRIGKALGIDLNIIENLLDTSGEVPKIDWDARHTTVAKWYDRVVVIHSDILVSRIGASCVQVVPEEKLLLLTG